MKASQSSSARKYLAEGRCQQCGKVKTAARREKLFCASCQKKRTQAQQCLVRSHAPRGVESGIVRCLWCDEWVYVPNRKAVRYHDRCRDMAASGWYLR